MIFADRIRGIFKPSLLLMLFLSAAVSLSALSIPDNSAIRRQLNPLMTSAVSEISVSDGRIIEDRFTDSLVKLEIERNEDKLYMLFINQRELGFPVVGSGNFIIRRSLQDGRFEQVKIYLDDIGALVLRITPSGNRSNVSLSLFNDELYSRLPIAASIDQVLEMDIQTLIDMTSGRIPWDRLYPQGGDFSLLTAILNRMRLKLPELPDADDGAMDEFGNLVYIESLKTNNLPGFNCSGFAKYLADGIYAGYTGRYMTIDSLKVKHPDVRGNDISLEYEDERDPYFGLDWTRNIAVSIMQARGEQVSSPEDADVRDIGWYDYTDDMGYRVEDLIPVLYLQAIHEPGRLYLGSVNGEFGSDPVLWQHYHVVTLFPYFDDSGRFRVAVLERNVETSVASLQRRYSGQFIHLVGLDPAQDFILQEINFPD